MAQLQLIVNGDDFGMSKEVNSAVIRAYKEGVLTACSLMAGGEAFDEAVRLARENEGLAVGIHLTCVMGRSVLPPEQIPSIVDREGNFSSDPGRCGLQYYFSPQARREIRKELAAQFEKFRASGLRFSHIDSHLHMHVHPVIFDAALELGEKYGVKRMRVPDDDFLLSLRFNRQGAVQRALYALVFHLLTGRMKRKLKEKGFTFTERVYGNFFSGRMSEDYVLFLLDRLRGVDTGELYLHPASLGDGDEAGSAQRQCAAELDILLSERVRARVRELGIHLTNYPDLEALTR